MPKNRCPYCGLYFLSRELALFALLAGCPGCGQGLYGGPPPTYLTADGTEIPDPPRPYPLGPKAILGKYYAPL